MVVEWQNRVTVFWDRLLLLTHLVGEVELKLVQYVVRLARAWCCSSFECGRDIIEYPTFF